MFGSTNDNDPIRFGGGPPLVGDGPNAFPFKPLDLKSSHYTAEAMKLTYFFFGSFESITG
jgi:WRKY transcription factor 2